MNGPPSSNKRWGLLLLLLLAVTAAAYHRVGGFEFILFDDPEYLLNNEAVRDGLDAEGLAWAFSSLEKSNWHPLSWISHMVDCSLFGLDPGAHHLVNLALHLLGTAALFLFLFKSTGHGGASFFAAGVFALHPAHVESVAWISERKDVLSGVFFFFILLAYLAYTRRPGVLRYLAVLALFGLGLAAKPMLVTLPFLLLLLDLWPLKRMSRTLMPRRIAEKLPLFLLSGASCAITLAAQQQGGAVASLEAVPPLARFSNALLACWRYLEITFFPKNLAVFYPHGGSSSGESPWILAGLGLAIFSITAVAAARRRGYLFTGWFWFLGMLMPVIGLVQVGNQAYADRYLYLPQTGLAILVAWGALDLAPWGRRRRAVLAAGAAILLAVFGWLTFLQTAHWKNSITLFEHALAAAPGNYVAHNNLGLAFEEEGRLQEAIEQYEEALRIKPGSTKALKNLGGIFSRQGRSEEAARLLTEALRLEPGEGITHYNLAVALGRLGRIKAAAEHYAEAAELLPGDFKVRYNWGNTLAQMKDLAGAERELRQALRIDSESSAAANNLGIVLLQSNRALEAAVLFRKALALDPNARDARLNLGVALLYHLKNHQEALAIFQELAHQEPENPEALHHFGWALAESGDHEKAAVVLRRSLKIRPEWPFTLDCLAWILATEGRAFAADEEEALRLSKKACEATQYGHPKFLDTLAAALAASGRMEEAAGQAGKALRLAEETGRPDLAESIARRRDTYLSGQTWDRLAR